MDCQTSRIACGAFCGLEIIFFKKEKGRLLQIKETLIMIFLITKYAITAFVIVLVSEFAKRSDKLGALISSLPFVTIMVMIWLYIEKQGNAKISSHAYYTFWYVLPTLPMFLIMPWLLTKGMNFWIALAICVAFTFICFILTAVVVRRMGVDLIP